MTLREVGAEGLLDKISEILVNPKDLSGWDTDFLSDMHGRLQKYGKRARVTPKQREQLERIFESEEASPVGGEPNAYPYEDTGGTAYWQKQGDKKKRRP